MFVSGFENSCVVNETVWACVSFISPELTFLPCPFRFLAIERGRTISIAKLYGKAVLAGMV